MQIHLFELERWETDTFVGLDNTHSVSYHPHPLDADNAADYADAEIVSSFIYSDLSAATLRQLPHLRLIATRSTGFDHIDLDYCREHGIAVCHVPSYGENTVAEHVFGLLLTISHHLAEAIDRTRKGDFSPEGLRGFDLRGKTLGVVGTGAIGRHVIEIAGGFRMNVIAYDAYPDEQAARELGFTYTDLDDLLGRSDVITLHVPDKPETHNLIGKAAFDRMKDGTVIINTARGGVMDVHALLEALSTGRVAAAGLDVLPDEPTIREETEVLRSLFRQDHDYKTLLADHVLLRMRNVFITPHTAFNTREALQRILDVTLENIEGFVAGRPVHRVDGG
jgi:D-lactate dehydrogenase